MSEETKKVKETKKISLSELKSLVEGGMKKDAIAAHYNLPMTQVTTLLKQAGLKIRKFHKPAFILEDDLEKEENSSTFTDQDSQEQAEAPDEFQPINGVVTDEQEVTEPVGEGEESPKTLGEAWK